MLLPLLFITLIKHNFHHIRILAVPVCQVHTMQKTYKHTKRSRMVFFLKFQTDLGLWKIHKMVMCLIYYWWIEIDQRAACWRKNTSPGPFYSVTYILSQLYSRCWKTNNQQQQNLPCKYDLLWVGEDALKVRERKRGTEYLHISLILYGKRVVSRRGK